MNVKQGKFIRKNLDNGFYVILSEQTRQFMIYVCKDGYCVNRKEGGTNYDLAVSVFNSVCSMYDY